MRGHPGGTEHTERMLALARLPAGSRVLDMGAGSGRGVLLLRALGYDAEGIDLDPGSDAVTQGDFLRCKYPDASFDGVLSQCAFYVSGDAAGAFRESYRLLRKGGVLMLSDVCYTPLEEQARLAGFRVLNCEDMTAQWRQYYIEALWAGTAECCEIRGKCAYTMLICGKD